MQNSQEVDSHSIDEPCDYSEEAYSPCRYKSQNTFVAPKDIGLNPNEKVVVTQEGIDDWRAQLYGIDLNKFPR